MPSRLEMIDNDIKNKCSVPHLDHDKEDVNDKACYVYEQGEMREKQLLTGSITEVLSRSITN